MMQPPPGLDWSEDREGVPAPALLLARVPVAMGQPAFFLRAPKMTPQLILL